MIKKIIVLIIVAAIAGTVGYRIGEQEPASVTDAGNTVIGTLLEKDYAKLETLVSKDGLTLDFYPRMVDTNTIVKKDISNIATDSKTRIWGYTDGKGDPVDLTTKDFLEKFIITRDYRTAPEIAVNKELGGGSNSISHIIKDAGDKRTIVAYYFKGFDPKYGGMDWTTMYLVFDKEGKEYKLRAIAKDNWTI